MAKLNNMPLSPSGKQYKTGNPSGNDTGARLSDTALERHLRVFINRIPEYHKLFALDVATLEHLRKQHAALSWILDMNARLEKYSLEIKELKKKVTISTTPATLSTLQFLDLPRPPVFYFEGNILNRFTGLIRTIKCSPFYTEGIGRDLGIDQFR